MTSAQSKLSALKRLAVKNQPRDENGRFAHTNGNGSSQSTLGKKRNLKTVLQKIKPPSESLEKKEVLGSGVYGTVYLTNKGTAYKEGRVTKQEIDILRKAGALGVAPKVLSVGKDDGDGNPTGFEMEFMGGYKPGSEAVTERRMRDETDEVIASNIAIAASKLHLNGLLHGDLHPDNVLVNDSRDAKVIDFGLSQSIDFTGEESDPKAQALKNYKIIQEIDRVHDVNKMFGRSDHPVVEVYRNYAYEIDDDMFLFNIMVPDDDDELKSHNDARSDLIKRFYTDLQNAAKQ